MPHKLRALIDGQHIDELNQYLIQNPDIDLNNVTPSGASALWVAVMPPRGKEISHLVIRALIATRRVDPTQHQYGEKIASRFVPLKIQEELHWYEQQYVDEQRVENRDLMRLRNIALNTQSTHDSLVVKTYDAYITKLYRRYVIEQQKNLCWNDNIQTYINTQPSYQSNIALANAITRIRCDRIARDLSDFNASLTNTELLMLIWHAYNDNSPDSFIEGTDMGLSEQFIRKNRLLDALIEAQHGNGPNKPACFMGTRHKMIESLDKVHRDCVPCDEESLLLPEHIAEMYATHCHQEMSLLQKNNVELWRQYLHHIWEREDSNNPDLVNWIAQVRTSFLTTINQEQGKRPPSLRIQEGPFKQQLALYSDPDMPLDNRLHAEARLSEQLSAIQSFLNNPDKNFIRWVEIGIDSMTQDDLNWRQLMTQGVIDDLYSESVLWLILENLFQNTSWQHWIKALPAAIKSVFFKTLINRTCLSREVNEEADDVQSTSENSSILQRFSSTIIHQVALEIAMNSGCWREFYIEDTLIFENKDLRGFDFSSIDLSKIIFKKCDLRLTGILANPTLTHAHLSASNIIESDALFIAARNNLLKMLDILTDSNEWENKTITIYNLLNIDSDSDYDEEDHYMTPLFFAASNGHIEAVQLVLIKTSTNGLNNARNGFVSIINARTEDIAITILEKYASAPGLFEYRHRGTTLFVSSLNKAYKKLAENILKKQTSVACDKDDYGHTALRSSLWLDAPHLTNMIFDCIPKNMVLEMLMTKCWLGTPVFLEIVKKGNAYLATILSILKRIRPEDLHIICEQQNRTALIVLAELRKDRYWDYNEVVNAILESNSTEVFINARRYDLSSALIAAAYHNNHYMVKAILQRNPTASVLNAKNSDGNTALMVAAAKNHCEVVAAILECLEDMPELSEEITYENNLYQRKLTALVIAAEYNHPNIVKLLLKHKSTETVVNHLVTKREELFTALIKAASDGHVEVMKALLEYNSTTALNDINFESSANHYLSSALLKAAYNGHVDIVKSILQYNSTKAIFIARNEIGETAFETALTRQHYDTARAILEFNATDEMLNICRDGDGGHTQLMLAAHAGREEIVKLILQYNQSEQVINAQTRAGNTALLFAINRGNCLSGLEVIRSILTANASASVLNIRNKRGETLLFEAIRIGNPDIVKTILEFNSSEAVLNFQNNQGETALSVAIRYGYFEVVRTILEFNSSETVLNFQNNNGVNVVMVAIDSSARHSEIEALISEKMRSPYYLLELQIKQLKTYGEKLSSAGQSQEEISAGEAAIDLATNLTRCLNAYYSSPESTQQPHKDEFNTLLKTGYHAMSEHFRPGFFHRLLIGIASLFRCLTTSSQESKSITPMGEVTAGFFFQTTRQKEVHKIATIFEQFNP